MIEIVEMNQESVAVPTKVPRQKLLLKLGLWIHKGTSTHIGEQITSRLSVDWAMINVVSQWWIRGLRTRKAKVMSSFYIGGSDNWTSIVFFVVFSQSQISLWLALKVIFSQRITFLWCWLWRSIGRYKLIYLSPPSISRVSFTGHVLFLCRVISIYIGRGFSYNYHLLGPNSCVQRERATEI